MNILENKENNSVDKWGKVLGTQIAMGMKIYKTSLIQREDEFFL